MKKIIIFLFVLLWSVQAFAIWPFDDDESELSSAEKVEPVKPRLCHYKIHISGVDKDGDGQDDQKVWYVFRGVCGNITQVGIIDELQRKVLEISNDQIVLITEYYGDNRKKALISDKWGDLNTIYFFRRGVVLPRRVLTE